MWLAGQNIHACPTYYRPVGRSKHSCISYRLFGIALINQFLLALAPKMTLSVKMYCCLSKAPGKIALPNRQKDRILYLFIFLFSLHKLFSTISSQQRHATHATSSPSLSLASIVSLTFDPSMRSVLRSSSWTVAELHVARAAEISLVIVTGALPRHHGTRLRSANAWPPALASPPRTAPRVLALAAASPP